MKEVEYLGHMVFGKGVKADAQKIEVMLSWPIPTTVKALRGFLDLTEYYIKFIKRYRGIATPLTQLLKRKSFIGMI